MIRLVMIMAVLLVAALPTRAESLTVFAASSLTDAIGEITEQFAQQHDVKIRLSVAASSTLARQIEHGAPADVFISADETWTHYLMDKSLLAAQPRAVAGNALVLIAATGTKGMEDFGTLVERLGAEGRLAIADPAHVPAGRYGETGLTALGQWDGVKERLAVADNVRAAVALVARGEAPLGIAYETDAAISDDVVSVYRFPTNSHPPVLYPAAVVKGQSGALAGRFLDYLLSTPAQTIFRKHGFAAPNSPGANPS